MRQTYLLGTLFVLAVLIVYSPVLSARYMLNFDDNAYLMYNNLVRNLNFKTALELFTTPDTALGTFVPLTALTFFYENIFFGLNPFVSHLINLLLHISVCIMVFVVARSLGLTLITAAIGAVIFAINPMHVEPVAWISSRKDLLYSFFFLSSVFLYLRYLESGRGREYIFSLLAAGCCVLSKPMGLSLPLVLCLIDWYKGRELSIKLVLEKIPFFMVIQPVALVTYVMNIRTPHFVWPQSFLLWLWCAMFYLVKFIFPVSLSVIYEPPLPISLANIEYLSALVLAVVILIAVYLSRKNRLLIFAFVFYVFCVFYIWRFDIHDLNFVADRFMYLPSLGICILIGFFFDKLLQTRFQVFIKCVLILLICLFGWASFHRSTIWKNSFVLWGETMKTSQTGFVLNAYGESILEENCFKDSKDDFIKYVSRKAGTSPEEFKQIYAASLNMKLRALRRLEAFRIFRHTLKRNPADLDALDNIGLLYTIMKKYDKAIHYFNRVIILSGAARGEYFFQRGVCFEYLGYSDQALADYNVTIFLGGISEPQARLNRAHIWFKQGRFDQAMQETLVVVKMNPTYNKAYDLAIKIANAQGDSELVGKFERVRRYSRKFIAKDLPK